jgi:hypothetical protein
MWVFLTDPLTAFSPPGLLEQMFRNHPNQDQKPVLGFPPLGPVVAGIPEAKATSATFPIAVG